MVSHVRLLPTAAQLVRWQFGVWPSWKPCVDLWPIWPCSPPMSLGLRKDTQPEVVLFEALKNSPWTPKCPAKCSWRDWFLVILFHPKSLWVHQESPRFLLVTSVGLYGSIYFVLSSWTPWSAKCFFSQWCWNRFCLGSLKPWGQSINQSINQGQVMSSFTKDGRFYSAIRAVLDGNQPQVWESHI